MTAKERILAIRLMEKLEKHPAYAETLGIKAGAAKHHIAPQSIARAWGVFIIVEEETEMLELLTVVVFMYLMFKAIGLALKLTWGWQEFAPVF